MNLLLHKKISTRNAVSSGMTLLELLVVLVILSIVATVAVYSLQPRVENARFEQTRNTLIEIQTATIGNKARHSDGTLIINGFVADIGRLPQAINEFGFDDDSKSKVLCELWDTECDLARNFPYRFRAGPKTPIDCTDIQIPCGWKGPYVEIPVGDKKITDAWSKPFKLTINNRSEIETIHWEPIPPFEKSLDCDLSQGKVTVAGTFNFGTAVPAKVQVVFIIPDPGKSITELTALADSDTSPTAFEFRQVPIGLRAIRVEFDGKKYTKYLQVPPQGLSIILDLETAQE